MKALVYRKFNLVLSFWLLAVMATLCVFGYKLDVFGCYVAAGVLALPLLASNIFNLITGYIYSRNKAVQTRREFN